MEKENKPQTLRTALKDMIVKYENLSDYIKEKDYASHLLFKDFIDDLKILEKICIDRNRY